MDENKMVVHIGKKTGKVLKEKREYLSMSLEEAASLTGITPGYLSLVEHGRRNLKMVELDKLLEILKMDLDHLIDKEQMALEQKIIDSFDELNTHDMKMLLNTCDFLLKSKSGTQMKKNIFIIYPSKSEN